MISILFLFLFSSICFAEDIVYTYLLQKNDFPSGFTNLLKNGIKNDHQPSRKTRALAAPNTNYFLLYVSPRNNENNFFRGLEESNKIIKINEITIVTEYDGRLGGNVTYVDKKNIKKLPDDFHVNYANFKVEFST